jgi:hypothetical protein
LKRPFPPIVDIPLAYAKEGTPVVVAEVDPATAKSTTDDFSRSRQKALAIPSDVPKSEDIARVVDATLKKFDGSTSSSTTRVVRQLRQSQYWCTFSRVLENRSWTNCRRHCRTVRWLKYFPMFFSSPA